MFDVVLTLFNKKEFIADTLASVSGQSFDEWRMFVVDDGSTDGGADIVDALHDPKITLIRQANQGVGPARNRGIAAGSAEWIAFLDGDDIWNADHLAELDELRRAFPDAALIGAGFQRFAGAGEPLAISPGRPNRRRARYFHECARGAELFTTSSAAVSRVALETIGAFEPLPGNEDVELWARLALHGPVAVSDKRTILYRTESGGITDTLARGPRKKPLEREQLSSTIPTLSRLLPGIDDPELARDIAEYMDSRIGLSMIGAVLAGDFAYARQLRALYRTQPLGKARWAALIARLPNPLARLVVSAGLRAKRLIGKLSPR